MCSTKSMKMASTIEMSGAEFDTRRVALGLSRAEVAEWCGVQERTVIRWRAGTLPIAPAAIERLLHLEDMIAVKVEQLVETVAKRSLAGPIDLVRYRTADELNDSVDGDELPAGAHAIYVAQASDALQAEGIATRIVWADEVG